VTRLSIIILILITSCVRDNAKDNLLTESRTIDSIRKKTDTTIYQALAEPPSIGVKVKTDSSVITTNTYEDENSIREFNELDSVVRTYYKEYYFDTHKIKEEGVFEDHYCVGLWKYYDKNGKLYKEIDFETGNKKLYNNRKEPFDNLFLEARHKGDSIVTAFFGANFFNTQIQWDPNRSYFYSDNDSGVWFDIPREKPNRFLLRYFLRLDSEHKYSTIEFEMDRKGRIISGSETIGLKKCNGNCEFKIDYFKALGLAKQYGLKLTNKKHYAYLSWAKSKGATEDFFGDYELVVAEFVNSEKQGENRIVDNFDAVVIDPWTGFFLRKTTFKNVRHVHEYSASSSGLIESK
jgi:hypothetical protein